MKKNDPNQIEKPVGHTADSKEAELSELKARSANLTTAPASQPAGHERPIGEIIFSYTRAQALADGFQIEVTETAQEAGIRFPVFITRAVFDNFVAVPPQVSGQDEAGRLWDIVWMTRFAIIRSRPGLDRVPVELYVRNDNGRPRLVRLIATCGPLDIDDPRPSITIMMLDED